LGTLEQTLLRGRGFEFDPAGIGVGEEEPDNLTDRVRALRSADALDQDRNLAVIRQEAHVNRQRSFRVPRGVGAMVTRSALAAIPIPAALAPVWRPRAAWPAFVTPRTARCGGAVAAFGTVAEKGGGGRGLARPIGNEIELKHLLAIGEGRRRGSTRFWY